MSTVLVSLDLSTAFDTIDHCILINRLQSSFGIHSTALSWFHSYLSNRTQFVQIDNSRSSNSPCPTGMQQGSVLGLLLFSLYTSPIGHIVSSFGLLQQLYAHDTQIYVAVSRLNQSINIRQLEQCLSAQHAWFSLNGLALNPSKSEVILMGTRQHAASLPPLSNINVAGSSVPFSSQVKLLGVILDSSRSLNKDVAYISKSCFFHLRALRHIRHIPHWRCSENHRQLARRFTAWLRQRRTGWHVIWKYQQAAAYPEHTHTGADCYVGTIWPKTQREH